MHLCFRNPVVFVHMSAEPTAICCCSYWREFCAAFDHCPWSCNSYRQRRHYAVSCVAHSIGMFSCATTVPQHQTSSFRLCVSFAGCVAGHATSRLWQHNSRMSFHLPAQSTSVGAQCCRQTDTSISSVRASYIDATRFSLAAVSGTHRL